MVVSEILLWYVVFDWFAGYIAYNFVIGAYSYWGPKAGYNIYHMVGLVVGLHMFYLNFAP